MIGYEKREQQTFDCPLFPLLCLYLQKGFSYFFLTSSLKKHAFYNLLINNILYLCVT